MFRSSSIISRGFCPKCGTPLTFANDESEHMSVSIGSLDHPERVTPEIQFGTEAVVPAFAILHTLPGQTTEEDLSPEQLVKLKSRQHPDHEKMPGARAGHFMFRHETV